MKQPNRIGVAFGIQKDADGAHEIDVDMISMFRSLGFGQGCRRGIGEGRSVGNARESYF